jgi:hypothetical protein
MSLLKSNRFMAIAILPKKFEDEEVRKSYL